MDGTNIETERVPGRNERKYAGNRYTNGFIKGTDMLRCKDGLIRHQKLKKCGTKLFHFVDIYLCLLDIFQLGLGNSYKDKEISQQQERPIV